MKQIISKNISTVSYINILYTIVVTFALLLFSDVHPMCFTNLITALILGLSLTMFYITYNFFKHTTSLTLTILGTTLGSINLISFIFAFLHTRSNATSLNVTPTQHTLVFIGTLLLCTSLIIIYCLSEEAFLFNNLRKRFTNITLTITSTTSLLFFLYKAIGIDSYHVKLLIELAVFIAWGGILYTYLQRQKIKPSALDNSIIIICIHYLIIYLFYLYTRSYNQYTHFIYITYMLMVFNIYKVLNNLFEDYKDKYLLEKVVPVRIDSNMDFFTNISHELKTPVNVIYSSLQMQEFYLENNNITKAEVYTKSIRQNCLRLIRLINNSLDLNNLSTNTLSPKLVTFDVVEMLEDITNFVEGIIAPKNLSISFNTNVEEKIMESDPLLLQRALLNLISNSVKFSKVNGHIEVILNYSNGFVTISVKDDGIGIPKDRQASIFKKFTQIDPVLTRKAEGCGIGLSLVQGLVQALGGTISFVSKESVGSEFSIKLYTPYNDISDFTSNFWDSSFISHDSLEMEFTDVY